MDKKAGRIISLYNRVVDGEVLVKADEGARYGVNEKSIQRDIDDIRAYFANEPDASRELVYDRSQKGYVMVQNAQKPLTNSEILTGSFRNISVSHTLTVSRKVNSERGYSSCSAASLERSGSNIKA